MAEEKRRRRRRSQRTEQSRATINTRVVSTPDVLSEDDKVIELEVRTFPDDVSPAFVRVSHGATKSLGQYESMRCDVAVTMPCYAEEVDQVREALGERVADMLDAEFAEYGIPLTEDD